MVLSWVGRGAERYMYKWVSPFPGRYLDSGTCTNTLVYIRSLSTTTIHNIPSEYYLLSSLVNLIYQSKMSSSTPQYAYIPNLVGRQMLRVALEDVVELDVVSSATTTALNTKAASGTSSSSRDSSPAPSLGSVRGEE
ncbi:hypothetical protein BDV95DRAFT_572852 [Massariosphaeria phaeospora]|uniref:Uncharacterized protein n=1 Tax=Massariosphaeria phaeospora TaxID=100035 RepID=A0A7C8I659_9PLEO|nr:hypothetical protein BDV95DRAFT_572852 [Massariosphaeria phaeospora]